MAIENLHSDREDNRRQRLLKQPSVEDQLDALWEIVLGLVDDRKLKGKTRERVKALKKARKENPADDD